LITIEEYEFDENLHYFTGGDGHVWLEKLDDGKIKVGFDDFGQKLAGKILFVRTVPPGKARKKGSSLGTQAVKDTPALINDDPYGNGWIAIIEPDNLEEDLKTDMIFGADALKEWIIAEVAAHVK